MPFNEELTGALHLVDLAGSERLDKSLDPGSWRDGYPAENEGTSHFNRKIHLLGDGFKHSWNFHPHLGKMNPF